MRIQSIASKRNATSRKVTSFPIFIWHQNRKTLDKCSFPLLCKYQAFSRCKLQCFQLLTRVDAICYGSTEEQDYHFKGGHYSKWLSPKSSRSKGFFYLKKESSNNKSHLLSLRKDLRQFKPILTSSQ